MLQSSYFTDIAIQNVKMDGFASQPQRFNQSPVQFPNLPIHSELANSQGNFIVAILNEASSKAGNTPGRLYQWNAFCINGGNNKELQDTLILAANYTALGLAKNAFNSIDAAAMNSIPFVLERRGAYIAAICPELLKMYPIDVQQNIKNAAQEYVNMVNEVTGYINSRVLNNNQGNSFNGSFSNNNGFNNQQQNNGFGGNNNNQGNSFGGNSFGNNMSTGRNNLNTNQNPGNSFGANHGNQNNNNRQRSPFVAQRSESQNGFQDSNGILSTGVTKSTGSVDVAGILNMMKPEDREKVLKKHQLEMEAKEKSKSPQLSHKPQATHVAPEAVFTTNTVNGTWSPSKLQPYALACSAANAVRSQITKTDNGQTALVYQIKPKTQEELKMDRDQHRTGTTESAIQRSTQLKVNNKVINSRGDYLKSSLDILANTHNRAFNDNEQVFNENLSEYFIGGYSLLENSESSLDSAINMARQLKVLTSDLNQLGAHRVDFDLDRKFVVPKDEVAEFQKVIKVSNLTQLAAKLKAALLDDERSLAYNSALIQLDSYIKSNLLRMVRHELGLSDYTSLGNFVDDFNDLIDGIKDDGDIYFDAFKKMERAFISRYLTAADDYEVIGNDTGVLANVILKIRSSVTVVDFLYQELDLDLVPNVSNVVIKSEFPTIYEFLDELVSNDYIKEGDVYYGNHWLVTADNEVIRIHRGALDNKTILISKV